jgi:segregation and condensation protein B
MKTILERFFRPRSRPPMSQATYETLAVVAYNQPVTRAQVESVRGVSSDSIIARLLERGWIQECGTLDAPGRPVLFETTQQFLMEFGIESATEMPAMDLMMYSTIRDLEESLETAAGTRDVRQVSIDSLADANDQKQTDCDEG